MSRTITIHAAAHIEAAAPGKPRRFRIEPAYAGGPLRLHGFDLPVVVDLATMTMDEDIVANLDHEPSARVGHVDDHQNDGKSLTLAGVVSAASAAAQEFIESAERKFPWKASIEAEPGRLESIARGKSVSVNGRSHSGPLYVSRGAKLYGIAILSKGADSSARAVLASKGKKNMSDFQAWGRQMLGDSFDTLDQSGIARLHANYEGRTEPTAADLSAAAPLIAAAASDPVEMERRRISRIESACRPGKWGEQEQRVSELKAAALAGSISEDGLRTELLECVKASIPMAHTVRSVNRTAANALTIEAALCQAINLPDLEKHFSDQILQAAHTAFRGRLGLQQILIQAAHGNGLDIMPGERISTGNLKRILKFALPDDGPQTIKAQGYSTLSVSGILSNTANKSLLLGWTESDQTWREVAQVKPSSDFKTATSYRLLDSLEYEQVGPAGEITHGTASNESYTRTINTYAKMLALTRTDIINDDLSAFEDLRVRIGRGAARKFNNLFWAKWLDDGAFFATAGTNNNYISGATTNLGTDGVGLTAGVLKFRKLVSSDGKRVDGEPVILLVPPEVEWIARRLFNSTKVIGSTTANAPVGDDNVFAGLYRPVVQPRLSDSAFTGNSTTAWWLLRSPAMGAVAVASFLNGQQNPTVETADADFNTLGIQLRGYHDFGVDLTVDYVAGIKSKGAA